MQRSITFKSGPPCFANEHYVLAIPFPYPQSIWDSTPISKKQAGFLCISPPTFFYITMYLHLPVVWNSPDTQSPATDPAGTGIESCSSCVLVSCHVRLWSVSLYHEFTTSISILVIPGYLASAVTQAFLWLLLASQDHRLPIAVWRLCSSTSGDADA